MVRWAYAKLGYIARLAAAPLLRLYAKRRKPRVRVLIFNEKNEILLVRSWFSHQQWSLPGGGIQRGEMPILAAIREAAEETGINLAHEDLEEAGGFVNPDKSAPFVIICYRVTIFSQTPRIRGYRHLEILEVGWFPIERLPIPRSSAVDMALSL